MDDNQQPVLTESTPVNTASNAGMEQADVARRPAYLIAGALVVGIIMTVLIWQGNSGGAQSASPLPDLKPVPSFVMTNQDGMVVTHETWLGKPWIADFIFTDCPGPCPKMSQRMLSLQRALEEAGLTYHLASFSLDPLRDRPPILKKYAQRFKADESHWSFLTCDDEDFVWELAMDGFMQTVKTGDEEHKVFHSTYFILVGPKGNVRNVYNGLDPDIAVSDLIDKILSDVRSLQPSA
ncbi:MAG: SCO family protein [Phycisphaerae bacterium]